MFGRLSSWVRRRRADKVMPKTGAVAYLERVTADNQARLESADAVLRARARDGGKGT